MVAHDFSFRQAEKTKAGEKLSEAGLAILALVGAPVLSVIGVLIASAFTRRTGRESNDTDAFTAITNVLMKQVGDLTTRVESLEKDNKAQKLELDSAREEVRTTREEAEKARGEANRLGIRVTSLERYVKKLVGEWPLGTPLPTPDDPMIIDGL